ncbi:MAG: polyhydroxyalkanoic acid system family protein [Nanoarchaeota archaeon]|nr:polyhydroxyalkanoic acid system family protein [Nanoarchaeota archaeon]
MIIEYQHSLTTEEAYRRIDNSFLDFLRQHADNIRKPLQSWNPEHTRMDYSMEIMGGNTEGQVTLREGQVNWEGKVPSMGSSFNKKIEEMVRKKLDDILS